MLLLTDKQPGMLRKIRSCLLGNVREDIGRSYWSNLITASVIGQSGAPAPEPPYPWGLPPPNPRYFRKNNLLNVPSLCEFLVHLLSLAPCRVATSSGNAQLSCDLGSVARLQCKHWGARKTGRNHSDSMVFENTRTQMDFTRFCYYPHVNF